MAPHTSFFDSLSFTALFQPFVPFVVPFVPFVPFVQFVQFSTARSVRDAELRVRMRKRRILRVILTCQCVILTSQCVRLEFQYVTLTSLSH
jgi:hypothetical protein